MIDEVRTFVAVVRYGTFTEAGLRIGLSQAAVSGHIRRLEQHLGFPLFERSGRAVRLNEAGAQSYHEALDLLAHVDRFVSGHANKARRHLRVGAINSVQSSLVASAVEIVRGKAPHLFMRIVPGVSLQLFDQLASGELGLILIIKPPFALGRDLAWIPLLSEPFMLAVPAAWEDKEWRTILQSSPFIRYDRVSFGGRQVDRFLRKSGLLVDEVVELDDLTAAMAMVARGVGASLVPICADNHLDRRIRLVSLGEDTFFREVGVVSSADAAKDEDINLVIESLVRTARDVREWFAR